MSPNYMLCDRNAVIKWATGVSNHRESGMLNSICNVPQVLRPVDVAIHLHGATLVIDLRPAIAIGCIYDGSVRFPASWRVRL
jgi:hypothetical protein